jgi:glutamate-1-semialdehyde aminotransferase
MSQLAPATYVRFSGTLMVCPAPCFVHGIQVQTATGAGISIMDGTATIGVFPVSAVSYYPIMAPVFTSCSIVAGGTITATVGIG